MTALTTQQTFPITDGIHQHAGDAASHRQCFRIGVVDVSITSEVEGVLPQYTALYRDFIAPDLDDALCISLRRERSRFLLGRRYVIRGDGERLFSVTRMEEVLPHLEWAVNWQIVRHLKPYLQLHAGVMQRGGAGFIFPGPPGSGKTTLCAGLLTHGWHYLSDEFALLDFAGMLHPYPKALCIKEGAFGIMSRLGLPMFSPRRYRKGAKGRVAYLRPRDVGLHTMGNACPLRYVVFPTYRQGAAANLSLLSRGEATFLLTQQSFNPQGFKSAGLELLANAIQQAQCYRLTSGDLDATCHLMDRLASGNDIE